ncbi:MAG TPA: alpha/beta fold hydrolase [Micromonosporaceae bacterium]
MESILLLHPLGASRRTWVPVLARLRDRFRVIAPDLPGHGEAAGPFTLARAVDVVRRLAAAEASPLYLVGVSAGATVALLAALDGDVRVAGLVLSAPIARSPRSVLLRRAATATMPRSALEVAAGRPYAEAAAQRESVIAEWRRSGRRTVGAGLRDLSRVDLRSRLGGLGVPVLVLCGERDRHNLPLAAAVAAAVPGAELRIVPRAGHVWHLAQPDTFAAAVAGFVDALAGAGRSAANLPRQSAASVDLPQPS